MRYSQFAALSSEMLMSYKQDLYRAMQEGRNPLTEKYAYMMEFTDPDYFDRELRKRLPAVSPQKGDLVDRIANILIGCEQKFAAAYPALAGRSRPLLGSEAGNVSFHLYTIGELKTYSEETLRLYYDYLQVLDMEDENVNPSFVIHRNTVMFYGYDSLEDAERKLR